MNSNMMHSPYGDISKWVDKKNVDRYDYAYKVQFEDDNFKPLSAWYCIDAFGNRLYFKARDRKKAMELMQEFFGHTRYGLISDRHQQIR